MTWFTWRQSRAQMWVAIGALVAIGVALAVAAKLVADMYNNSGAATCTSACDSVIANYLDQAMAGATGFIYHVSILALYALPALIGAFWGAPLIARELEAGTHRLAWNQSVTRTRWLVTKLAIVGGAAAVTMGLLSLGVTWFSSKIDRGDGDRIGPMLFGARGVVPIAYAVFAFALGVTLGTLIRRTIPAMALTLAVYVAAAVAFPQWVRGHLVPATHVLLPLDTENLTMLGIYNDTTMVVTGGAHANGWIMSNETVTPAGQVFTGPVDPRSCGRDAEGPRACEQWLNSLNLRQSVTYQPASHFWALQWVETGIYLAAAALLLGLCLQWTRKRLT